MNKELNKNNWKKPTGVIKALNAFDGEKRTPRKMKNNGSMMRRTGNLIKVVNNFSSNKPRQKTEVKTQNSKIRRTGNVIKVVNSFSSPGKKPPDEHVTKDSSPQRLRKHGTTVMASESLRKESRVSGTTDDNLMIMLRFTLLLKVFFY